MSSVLHQLQHLTKPNEVELFGGTKWTFFEAGDHGRHEIRSPLHTEATQGVVMIVVSLLLDHHATPEDPAKGHQGGSRTTGLDHGKLVLDLPAQGHPRVSYERDRETSFPVDEADGPLLDAWPFLLIVRTGRVVTAHSHIIPEGCDSGRVPSGYTGFPAYSRLHCAGSLPPGATASCKRLKP